MEYTRQSYVGNGSTSIYSITFSFLKNSEIKATINGTLTTSFVFVSSNQIQFLTAPANGATIDIFRETDDTQLAATLSQGSTIRSSDLNENFNQAINLIQEVDSNIINTILGIGDYVENVEATLAATTATANAALPKAGGTMTGAIVLPADPSTNLQAATKQYVDTVAAGGAGAALLKTGGTMTGNLVFAAGQPTATTSTKNIVQLTDSVSSTSTTTAATPAAVKVAKDAADAAQSTANTANTTANAALPKSGGTMTGVLNFDLALQTKASTSTYGITQLTNSTTSTDTGTAATAASAKAAADLANTAQATANAALPKAGGTMTGNLEIGTAGSLTFEGATADGFETTLAVVDPTADRTITLPDVTGTVVTTGDTGTVTSTMILDGTIVDADINAAAAIVDTKLATISTAGKVNNSATTATNTNTASAIVARDASGNFSAGTITASLTGNASTVTTNANLTGDVTSVGNATTIAAGVIVDADVNASAAIVDTKLATIATAGKVSNSATTAASANTASAIVARDASGNFTAGTITAALTGAASANVLKAGDTMTGVLAVTAGTAALPGIAVSGDLNTGIYSPGADQLAISTNGTGRLFVNSSGQVGINGAPPAWASSSSISVNEAAFSPALSYVGGEGELTHNAYYDGAWKYSGTGYQASRIQLGIQGAISFLNTPTIGTAGGAITWQERLRITSGGLVGIGTGSPGNMLSVVKATAGDVISFTNAAANNKTGFLYSDSQTVALMTTAGGGNDQGILFNLTNGNTQINRIGGSTATFTSAGLVGIGNTAPDANSQLHIVGSSYQPLYVNTTAAGGGGAVFFRSGTQALYAGTAGSSWLTGSSTADGLIRSEANLIFATGGNNQRAQIDSSGRLLVGTSAARDNFFNTTYAPVLQIEGTTYPTSMSSIVANGTVEPYLIFGRTRAGSIGGTTVVNSGDACGVVSFQGSDGTELVEAASIAALVDGTPGANDMPGRLVFSTTADGAASPTEQMRIGNQGTVFFGTTAEVPSTANVVGATFYRREGLLSITRDNGEALSVNRKTSDGNLVVFHQDGTVEGTITVSGTTVSYNGAHLSRWSQLPSGVERTEILRGSVLSNIDEMCEWDEEDNEQLNRMKVSDVEGDKNVSGVFQAWDDDDDTYTDDFYCAMTGDFIIRIAEGVTVERGDLLMSAGDGTAKPQDDDIIRSKTVAKVTSTNVSCTYEDGSYCVPCVLMAC
jgi:hypothetical protein